MWPFKKKKKLLPMGMVQTEFDAVKPSDAIIYAVATGDYNLWLFPYQYANWAAEQQNLPRKYYVNSAFTFGDAVMIVNACKDYVRYKNMVAMV